MFDTEKTIKIRIIAPLLAKREVIRYLHEAGCMDIKKSNLAIGDDLPDSLHATLNDQLIRISAALEQMKKPTHNIPYKEVNLDPNSLVAELVALHHPEEIFSLNEKKKHLEEKLISLAQPEKDASYFEGMNLKFGEFKSDRLSFKAFIIDAADAERFRKEVKNTGLRCEIISKRIDKARSVFFIAYDKAAKAEELMLRFKTFEIDLNAEWMKGTPEEIRIWAKRERAETEHLLSEVSERIENLSKEAYVKLYNYKRAIEIEMPRCAISNIFKKTDHLFMVEGWIPEKAEPELKSGLARAAHEKCYVEQIKTDELPPTIMSGKGLIKPFEYTLEFFSLPRSDEINPALIYMLSMPLFYGLMISDVGYGILSLLVSTYITKITDPEGLMYNAAKIWQINSVAVMFFGFLSNNWFGLPLNQYFTTFTGFNWFHDLGFLIVATIIFGIAQVSIGLFLGFINKYRHGHKFVAFGKLASIVVLIAGTIAIAGAFFGAFSGTVTMIAGIIALIALIATVVLLGMEAVEITTLIAHPLSYTRILGFGFAGIILGSLIDMGFTPTLTHGILVFILFTIVFIILHFLNMLLSMFEGIIQGVRLNFIEFFTKFYMGNGVKFRPFAYKRPEGAEKVDNDYA